MMETIQFEFWFESDYWKDPPGAIIKINGVEQKNVLFSTTGINYISFYASLELNTSHLLEIARYGKDNFQTLILDTGERKDQMLSIRKIKIDGIDIQRLIYINSWNEPDYPEPWATEQKNNGVELETKVYAEVDFGFNGTWKLEFSSPFYKHIIESIS